MNNNVNLHIESFNGVDIWLDRKTDYFYANIGLKAGSTGIGTYYNQRTHRSTRLRRLREAILAETNNVNYPKFILEIRPSYKNNKITKRTVVGRNGEILFLKGGGKCDLRRIRMQERWGTIILVEPDMESEEYRAMVDTLFTIGTHQESNRKIAGYIDECTKEIKSLAKTLRETPSPTDTV